MGSTTRAMAKKEEAGKKAEADKKGLETKSLEGSRSVEKTKPELTGEDRKREKGQKRISLTQHMSTS